MFFSSSIETTLTYLEAVGNLHDDVTGEVTLEKACITQELMRITESIDVKNNLSKLHAQLSCGYSS